MTKEVKYETALVTGASSGIGRACVRALTAAGLKVTALARREDRLTELAEETGCDTIVLDLNDTEALYRTLEKRDFDVLINNAGLGRSYDGFLQSPPHEIDEMVRLNVSATMHVVRALAPGMVTRARGHIVNMGSITGLYPVGLTVYGATKGACHLFTQNMRLELKGTGVRITEIHPGRAETEFFDTVFKDDDDRKQFVESLKLLQPEDIAAAVVYAIGTPWHVNVNRVELMPTEQIPFGVTIAPVDHSG